MSVPPVEHGALVATGAAKWKAQVRERRRAQVRERRGGGVREGVAELDTAIEQQQ